MVLLSPLELDHRVLKSSCDLLSKEVIDWRLLKLLSRVFDQVIDLLKFLSFLRLVLDAPI